MQKILFQEKHLFKKNATFAEIRIKLMIWTTVEAGFALINVRAHLEECPGWMIYGYPVSYVEHILGKINMQRKDFVLVPVGIKSIKKLEKKEDVYCLETNNGNFIANGVVVKNCDALRYAIKTHKASSFNQTEHNRRQEESNKQVFHPSAFGFR